MKQRNVEDTKPLNSMKLPLKKLEEQVMVITGATSGIGLVTARMAAKKGAKLVLAGRDKEALQKLAEELGTEGAQVIYVEADVSKEEDVKKLARKTIESFGGFDTWVNNAAVALYGHIMDVPVEDARELFEVNYWGTVYGSMEAVRHFKAKNEPGALINLGSVVGNRTFPIQGTYSSSKFAVHSFTDALRMDAEKEGIPVVVSQIHPARVDTPYTDHAASYIDKAPAHDGMMYPPESVAEAILHAAEHPVRDMYVGGQSKMLSLMGALMPRVTDRYLEKSVYKTNYDESQLAAPPEESTLHGKGEELQERGSNNTGWKRKGSWMVKAKKHPAITAAAVAGTALLVVSACLLKKNKGKLMMHHPEKTLMLKGKKAMLKHPKKALMLKHPQATAKMAKKHLS